MLSKKRCKDSGFFLITNFLHLVFFGYEPYGFRHCVAATGRRPETGIKSRIFFRKYFAVLVFISIIAENLKRQ